MTARVLTLACLFASTARAQEAAADPDAVVRELLELSGKRKHFEQLVLESQAQLDAKRSQLKPKDIQRFRASTRTVYQVAPLYQVAFEHYRSAHGSWAPRCGRRCAPRCGPATAAPPTRTSVLTSSSSRKSRRERSGRSERSNAYG